jgi:C_GCAxxG_C_C family probable redox protein
MDNFESKRLQALADFDGGYNCAQSVFRQFCEEYGVSLALSTRIASGFGGGLKMAKTCGAVSGAIMSLGLIFGFEDTENSEVIEQMNNVTLQFLAGFKSKYNTTDCKEILGIDVSLPGNRMKAKESGVMQHMCPDCINTAMNLISIAIRNQINQ